MKNSRKRKRESKAMASRLAGLQGQGQRDAARKWSLTQTKGGCSGAVRLVCLCRAQGRWGGGGVPLPRAAVRAVRRDRIGLDPCSGQSRR